MRDGQSGKYLTQAEVLLVTFYSGQSACVGNIEMKVKKQVRRCAFCLQAVGGDKNLQMVQIKTHKRTFS